MADEDQVNDDDFPAKEEWLTLGMNEDWKPEYRNKDLQTFWITRLKDTPTLARQTLKILTSFSTTYRSEQDVFHHGGNEKQEMEPVGSGK